MIERVSAVVIAAFGTVIGQAAFACAVYPQPFDPAREAYDVALIGTVTNEVGKSGSVLANLRVERVVSGQFPYPTYPLTYYVYDGRGMCPPPGPYLKKGQKVTVYLAKSPPNGMSSKAAPNRRFYPKGWQIRPNRQ